MKQLFVTFFLFIHFNGLCQSSPAEMRAIDSLKVLIKTVKDDTARINFYKSWDDIIYASDPLLDLELNEKISSIAEQNLAKKNLSGSELNTFKSDLAFGLNNIGLYYFDLGDHSKAIDYHIRSLKVSEDLGDKKGIAKSLNNIGIIYKQQGDNVKAIDYFTRSLMLQIETGNKQNIARCLNNIGLVYQNQKNYKKALTYFDSTLAIRKQIGDKKGIASSLSNIGSVYLSLGEFKKALDYQNQSLDIMEKAGDKTGVSIAFKDIGNIYKEMGKPETAISYNQKALALAQEINVAFEIRENSKSLYEDYKKTGNYKDALEMHEYYIKMRDSISNGESKKEVMKQEMQYTFEKQKAVDEKEHEKQIAVHLEQEKKQKVISYAIAAGLVLMLLFSFFVFNRLRITRKQKLIIEKQKHLVEEKQKEILDSITYAKRLQDAILPSDEFVKQHLPESFMLYKPKDIVAGDFYYMEVLQFESLNADKFENIKKEKPQLVLLAAADCTGHGVPGAMVSVVCSNALNRAILEFEITDPGMILDKVRDLVVDTFVRKDNHQGKNDKDVKDGMDISLALINRSTNEIKWAGANNPLWYITNGQLKEITADKQPIGKSDNPTPFSTHSIQLQKGDSLFLFTDGYADQFGGDKGKKFKYKPLKELLIKNSTFSLSDQKKQLEISFNDWKGNLEQVDDVCIIGIRL